jgi:Zn-dependent protease/predicted transcriptional regulator
MKWSLYIGKVSGIKIFIHWTFVFLIAWIIIGNIRAGETGISILYMLGFIASVFACVTLHELGHALMAKKYNYRTKDITLLPIGGIARMEEIPENPKHEFAVAIAGPLVNVVIAAILFPIVYGFGFIPETIVPYINSFDSYIYNLLYTNIILVAFNLLPAFPMDGGRIFRALLSMKMSRMKATAIAVRVGQVISVGFFVLGFFSNPFLIVIGIFIFFMAQTEGEYVKSKSMLQNFHVRDVIIRKYFSINATDTVLDSVKLLLNVQPTDFPVVDDHNHVLGTLNRDSIINALAEKGKDEIIANVMNKNFTSVSPEMPLDKVYTLFLTKGGSIFPVVQEKQFLGIVDISNIIELIMVKSAAEKRPFYIQSHKEDLEPKMTGVFFY